MTSSNRTALLETLLPQGNAMMIEDDPELPHARQHGSPRSERSVLSILCREAASAETVLRLLEGAGVPAGDVSILVRGVDVERRWLRDRELMSRGVELAREDQPLGSYARKISEGRRLLLEGCWAVGPVFLRDSGNASSQGIGSLSRGLLYAGVELRDAVRIETAVRGYGGIWLAMEGNRETLDRVESLLPRSESVEPGRLCIHSLSS